MSLYDYLNGEQIKFFSVPMIGIDDGSISKGNLLYFGGGQFRSFEKGKKVPYKTLFYNFGENFNIIDLEPYENDECMINLIRNGINTGFVFISDTEAKNVDLSLPTYEIRGTKLNVSSIEDIKNLIQLRKEFRECFKTEKVDAHNAWFNFVRNNKEKDSDPEYINKYKELYYQYTLENEANKKIRNVIGDKMEQYYIHEDYTEYEIFGGFVDGLFNYIKTITMYDPQHFYVNDERLVFIVCYNEMKKFLDMGPEFINQYFKVMEISMTAQRRFWKMLEALKLCYENLVNTKYEKEAFGEYVMKDILSGRYKNYYLKYNIEPYEGFDYSIWENSETEKREESYKKFNEELEAYVEKRKKEDGIL